MRTRSALYMLLICVVAVLTACGGDDVCPPPDATITLSPAAIEITDGSGIPTIHTEYFTIYVEDAQNRPIEGAKLSIYYWLAKPDVLGFVQLFDGATAVDAPFNAETDEFGVFYLRVDFASGAVTVNNTLFLADYSGIIEVRSCSVYGQAEFGVGSGA